ncbi:MarR family transcriptional regulator [Rhizobium sp. rho-13.1]|uniref:MarR family winged helix-turn-helix transcriptional regulator n=1 Tax=Rhizobium sp. B209b/85 TaxID=2819992 RepID=UPI00115CD4D7|nr:MarR family winged helix-turn-helix transcriptional regulator [Rhizobium sp. B209b/85]TQX86539.1 MarR family transcriptional regulator [Rhizobium sp. rho-13.1]TQY12265.1 MarR family transcriptional regulator [Rhizobium sp. rho-1.1]
MKTNLKSLWAEFAPLLLVSGRGWRRALNIMLVEHNLSDATAAPLITLLRLGDRIPQGVLADRVGIEGPTLVRVLDGLESDGLICRVPDDTDRRIKLVELTPAGKIVAERCEKCAAKLRETMLGDIPPEQMLAALDVLRIISTKASSFTGASDDDQ